MPQWQPNSPESAPSYQYRVTPHSPIRKSVFIPAGSLYYVASVLISALPYSPGWEQILFIALNKHVDNELARPLVVSELHAVGSLRDYRLHIYMSCF
jgi:hypothetical protein